MDRSLFHCGVAAAALLVAMPSPTRTIDPDTRAFFVGVGGTLQIAADQPEGDHNADFCGRNITRRTGSRLSRLPLVLKCVPVMAEPPPPEVFKVSTAKVACDGSGAVSPELGHPRVYLRIDPDLGFVECGYCDRRFVFEGGPADISAQ